MIYVSLTRGDNEKICCLFMTSVAASLSPISLSLVFLRFFLRRYRSRCTRRTSRLPINFSLPTHPTKLTLSPLPLTEILSYNFLLASKGIDIEFRLALSSRISVEILGGEEICGWRRWFFHSGVRFFDRKVIDRSIRRSEKGGFEGKGRAENCFHGFTWLHYFPAHVKSYLDRSSLLPSSNGVLRAFIFHSIFHRRLLLPRQW